MIFYFSATGNSKYVATKLRNEDEQIVSITHALREGDFTYELVEGESVGFVFPVYFYGIPLSVKEFIHKLCIKNIKHSYVYGVFTCGGTTGSTGEVFEELLQDRSILVNGLFSVVMVDNYIPLYSLAKKEVMQKILNKAEKELDEIATMISLEKRGDFNLHKGLFPRLVSGVVYSFYKNGKSTEPFYVENTCIGCGLCEKVCPVGAIAINNKKPLWIRDRCTFCLGCIHQCPQEAIQYGRGTKKRGRYQNPNVKK